MTRVSKGRSPFETLVMRLPQILIEACVRNALLEDLGRAGDVTSDATIPDSLTAEAQFVAREAGVIAGLPFAELAFELVDPRIKLRIEKPDGSRVAPGDVIARLEGPAGRILTGERVALNFLGHLSGVATGTARIADAIAHTKARIVCTRKTTPGLRIAEKYAVRCGGGMNHRFGLDDAILIKDNHIALAGGVETALHRARAYAGHMVKIELEVDTLAQLEQALALGVDAVLLDNMSLAELRAAVAMVDGRALTEASGRINLESAAGIAETGVDMMSAGWLTHSAAVLDIGLDIT
jgi:nicotinate-nucleotide pyrophosphorylase (carboxylating)